MRKSWLLVISLLVITIVSSLGCGSSSSSTTTTTTTTVAPTTTSTVAPTTTSTVAPTTTTTSTTTTTLPTYTVGSYGEAGIVFYDRGSYTTGLSPDWRYMEYAPSDQSTQEAWWNNITNVPVTTDTRMGYGKANADAIIAVSTASAAKLCRDYRGGGYDDWFLPSSDEFNQISFVSTTCSPEYKIVSPGVYWTSSYRSWDSGVGNSSAYLNGALPNWDWTSNKYRVRAAREF